MPTHELSSSDPATARTHRDSVAEVLDRPFAEVLVSRALLAVGHDALDVPCGTGTLIPRIAAVVGDRGSVTACEDDPYRLELARRANREIAWRRGAPEALPFDSGSFDAVLSCHGLDRRDDPIACLDEMRRVLRTGGRLSLAVRSDLDRNPLFAAVASVLGERLGGPEGRRRLAAYCAPFERSRADLWAERLERVGFMMVSIEEHRHDLDLPPLDGFLPLYLHAAGLGVALRGLSAEERDGVVAEVASVVGDQLDSAGKLPFRSFLAFGRAGPPGPRA